MVKTGFVWAGNCSDKGKPVSRKKLKQMVPLLEQHHRAKYRAVRAKLKALRRARNRQNELQRAAAKTAQSVQVPVSVAKTPGVLARFWLWLRGWLGRVPPPEGHTPGPPADKVRQAPTWHTPSPEVKQ
jgi:hypothetical protein